MFLLNIGKSDNFCLIILCHLTCTSTQIFNYNFLNNCLFLFELKMGVYLSFLGASNIGPSPPTEVLSEDPIQAGEGAREEIQRQACSVYCKKDNFTQTFQKNENQEQAEATQEVKTYAYCSYYLLVMFRRALF